MTTRGQYGVAAVVLAAGTSSRMGVEKALLPYPATNGTLLQAAIRALRPYSQMVLVIAGKNADALRLAAYGAGADLVVNPKPELGQFSSLRIGLHELLSRGRDTAFITHVDRPAPSSEALQQLWDAFVEHNSSTSHGKWAIVPEFGGKHGHPILAGREMIEAWLQAPERSTARDVEHAVQQRIEYVSVNDPAVVTNLNTPEDYERWKQSLTG